METLKLLGTGHPETFTLTIKGFPSKVIDDSGLYQRVRYTLPIEMDGKEMVLSTGVALMKQLLNVVTVARIKQSRKWLISRWLERRGWLRPIYESSNGIGLIVKVTVTGQGMTTRYEASLVTNGDNVVSEL